MRRREFIGLLGAGAVVAWPIDARAQSERARIAFLGTGKRPGFLNELKTGLRELGYDEGRNIDITDRFSEGRAERLPALAEELIRLKPAIIVASAIDAAVVVKGLTAKVPIVVPVLADALHLGMVASYARPGGNVTGIMPYVAGLPVKQMELAREAVPGARKVGLLGDMSDPKAPPQRDELTEAARTLGIELVVPEVRSPEDIEAAMQVFTNARVEVAIVLQTSMLLAERRSIAIFAAANRLPTVYGYRQHVEEGGLISYGVNLRCCFYRAAYFVHRILSGDAPGNLPVEFPTKLQLVVNLGTAKALGLTVPPSLLARADEVIE
jgi:putative tryptophan/tyrosine transport system substrate-binding protein